MPMLLEKKRCLPCEGGQPPLMQKDVDKLLPEINKAWSVKRSTTLLREFIFKDFKEALVFVDAIGALAEKEGHHPDIGLHWGRVVVELSTHAIGGLSENDFIMARKIDIIYEY